MDYKNSTKEEILEALNVWQQEGYIRIIDYSNLEIKLRATLSKDVEVDTSSLEEFIKEYRNLFKSKKVGVMGSSTTCLKNMQEFMKTYPQYSKEHILKATSAYIDSCASDGYKYLQQADYTIFKAVDHTKAGRTSRLLQWCEEIESGDYYINNTEEEGI